MWGCVCGFSTGLLMWRITEKQQPAQYLGTLVCSLFIHKHALIQSENILTSIGRIAMKFGPENEMFKRSANKEEEKIEQISTNIIYGIFCSANVKGQIAKLSILFSGVY